MRAWRQPARILSKECSSGRLLAQSVDSQAGHQRPTVRLDTAFFPWANSGRKTANSGPSPRGPTLSRSIVRPSQSCPTCGLIFLAPVDRCPRCHPEDPDIDLSEDAVETLSRRAQWVIVRRCVDEIQALSLQSELERHQIDSWIRSLEVPGYQGITPGQVWGWLLVDRDDLTAAEGIVDDYLESLPGITSGPDREGDQ